MEIYDSFYSDYRTGGCFWLYKQPVLKLPHIIGVMALSLVTSLGFVLVGKLHPGWFAETTMLIRSIDFSTILMKMMLSFLLFAGSIHIKLNDIRKERIPILTFSTIGVLISTFVVGSLLFFTCKIFQVHVAFSYCLLFGH